MGGGAACTAAACDLRAYTLGFDPATDVLLTDQIGTALLLLADVTISKIKPEIASGACARSGSDGVARFPPPPPLLSPEPPPDPLPFGVHCRLF